MPTITVQMFSGRSHAQKARLVRAITDATARSLEIADDLVRITLVEVEKENVARGGILASDG